MRLLLLAAALSALVAGAGTAPAAPRERLWSELTDTLPAWSPDGSHLSFSRGLGQTWLMRADGSSQRALSSSGFRWSPNGKQLAFLRGGALFVADAEVRRPQRIAAAAGFGFDWSPDGDRLVYTNRLLHVVDADGARDEQLTQDEPCNACYPNYNSYPEWSPDGARIAFMWSRSTDGLHGISLIRVLELATREQRTLPSRYSLAQSPSWWPDSRHVSYFDERDNGNGQQLVASVEDGSVARDPSGLWSPAGDRWVVAEAHALRIERRDGSLVHEIPRAERPSWSRDGRLLAYAQDGYVVVARADGSGARRVARGTSPAFGPTGLVAYADPHCGAGQGIHVVRADGRGDKLLTFSCSIRGSNAGDAIRALPEAQTVSAGYGDDVVHGGPGRDLLDGGPQDDRVFGDEGDDRVTGGAGVDILDGGAGNDLVLARDTIRDGVRCGPGRDRAVVDAIDLVAADCERVDRG